LEAEIHPTRRHRPHRVGVASAALPGMNTCGFNDVLV
jgi:hypothetical protein